MSVARFFGWVLILAGLGLALRDGLAPWLDHDRFHPISFGAVLAWSRLGPVIGTVYTLLLGYVLDPLVLGLQRLWAFAVLLGFGIVLLFLNRGASGRRHRR